MLVLQWLFVCVLPHFETQLLVLHRDFQGLRKQILEVAQSPTPSYFLNVNLACIWSAPHLYLNFVCSSGFFNADGHLFLLDDFNDLLLLRLVGNPVYLGQPVNVRMQSLGPLQEVLVIIIVVRNLPQLEVLMKHLSHVVYLVILPLVLLEIGVVNPLYKRELRH